MSGLPTERRHRPRWGVAALVAVIHLMVIAALVRAFTPDLARDVARSVTQAFTIEVEPPTPPAAPAPSESRAAPEPPAAAAAPGRKATPRAVSAPKAPIVITPTQAPPIIGRGTQNAAGAAANGEGTGASGVGAGAGAGGAGTGGGGGSPTVKIAGDINSAKDYPRASRDLRVGASVVIDLGVDAEGRVSSCRIVRPSPDSEADRITCDLATRRFRFRPAKDLNGKPVTAVYRWQQRWFY